MRELKNRS